jgi:hypothetical protein
MMWDCSEREQVRIAVEHDAAIDLSNAFEHHGRKLGSELPA